MLNLTLKKVVTLLNSRFLIKAGSVYKFFLSSREKKASKNIYISCLGTINKTSEKIYRVNKV